MNSDEPTNVKVARALGLPIETDGDSYNSLETHRWYTPRWYWTLDDKGFRQTIPDFANDALFVLRTIEANKIELCYIGEWVASTGSNPEDKDYIQTKGSTIGDALLAWLIAADAAGIEIER